MNVKFKGESLKWISNFQGEAVLWITSPRQTKMELMEFVGGYPNEYCIFVKNISPDDYPYLVPDLSEQPELRFISFTKHSQFGYSFVCSEQDGDIQRDGYYIVNSDGKLVRQCDV